MQVEVLRVLALQTLPATLLPKAGLKNEVHRLVAEKRCRLGLWLPQEVQQLVDGILKGGGQQTVRIIHLSVDLILLPHHLTQDGLVVGRNIPTEILLIPLYAI